MEIIRFLKSKGISNGIKNIFPVKFCSTHINSKYKNTSWFSIFGGSFFIIFKVLVTVFKQPKLALEKSYDVLFYVPNKKYQRFLDDLLEEMQSSFLIIGEVEFQKGVVSVDNFYGTDCVKHAYAIIKSILKVFVHAIRHEQIEAFKVNYWFIINGIRRELICKKLFESHSFQKYFSFHPVGDFHQIIQNFHKNKFLSTYAIRPTTTSFAIEHKYILTENLFYKTKKELEIYANFQLAETTLLAGGLIGKLKENVNNTDVKKVLFIDTCTNKFDQSIKTRREAIGDFLNYVSQENINFFYQFHPGLIHKEISATKKEIEKLDRANYEIIEESIPWQNINLVVGFDSTLFYDCFTKDIPVLSLVDTYDLYPSIDSEFSESPVLTISNKEHFSKIGNMLQDKTFYETQKAKQRNWFIKEYNFPKGMEHIIKTLEH